MSAVPWAVPWAKWAGSPAYPTGLMFFVYLLSSALACTQQKRGATVAVMIATTWSRFEESATIN